MGRRVVVGGSEREVVVEGVVVVGLVVDVVGEWVVVGGSGKVVVGAVVAGLRDCQRPDCQIGSSGLARVGADLSRGVASGEME